jgi:hypothetical protein
MYDESSEEATRLLPWARLENAAPLFDYRS